MACHTHSETSDNTGCIAAGKHERQCQPDVATASVKTAMLVPFLGSHRRAMWFYPHAESAMSQHFGFGGCQGTEGEIAHAISIPKDTGSVNNITESQYITSFSV